jgi:hypothetical protein
MARLEGVIAADVKNGQKVYYEAVPLYGLTEPGKKVASNYMPQAIEMAWATSSGSAYIAYIFNSESAGDPRPTKNS